MEIANVFLIQNSFGSDVPLSGVSPAELVILRKQFQNRVGKLPFHSLTITGDDAKRTVPVELERLQQRFHTKHVKAAYPGDTPVLPQKFSDVLTPSDLATAKQATAVVVPTPVEKPATNLTEKAKA